METYIYNMGKYNLSSNNRKVLSNLYKKLSKIKFYYLI